MYTGKYMTISKLRFRIYLLHHQGDNKTRKATIMVRTLWSFRESSLGKRTARHLVSEDLPHRSTPIQIHLM
jgi:hypothetical protein